MSNEIVNSTEGARTPSDWTRKTISSLPFALKLPANATSSIKSRHGRENVTSIIIDNQLNNESWPGYVMIDIDDVSAVSLNAEGYLQSQCDSFDYTQLIIDHVKSEDFELTEFNRLCNILSGFNDLPIYAPTQYLLQISDHLYLFRINYETYDEEDNDLLKLSLLNARPL